MTADEGPDPREILALIGAVAGHWSLLERSIDIAIWTIAETHSQIGACITSQIQSVRQKLIALEALVDLRGQEKKEEVIRKKGAYRAIPKDQLGSGTERCIIQLIWILLLTQ